MADTPRRSGSSRVSPRGGPRPFSARYTLGRSPTARRSLSPTWRPPSWPSWRPTRSWPRRSPSSTPWPSCARPPGRRPAWPTILGADSRIGRHSCAPGWASAEAACRRTSARSCLGLRPGICEALGFLREVDAINLRRREGPPSSQRAGRREPAGVPIACSAPHSNPTPMTCGIPPRWMWRGSCTGMGARVTVYDPAALDNARQASPELSYARRVAEAAQDAHVVLLLTEWPEFWSLNPRYSRGGRPAGHRGRPQRAGPGRVAGCGLAVPRARRRARAGPRPGSLAGMRARLLLAAAVVIALVAVGLAARRLLASPARPAHGGQGGAGRARRPPTSGSTRTARRRATSASPTSGRPRAAPEPGRLLQRLAAALRGRLRPPGQRARRHGAGADRPDLRLSGRYRGRQL